MPSKPSSQQNDDINRTRTATAMIDGRHIDLRRMDHDDGCGDVGAPAAPLSTDHSYDVSLSALAYHTALTTEEDNGASPSSWDLTDDDDALADASVETTATATSSGGGGDERSRRRRIGRRPRRWDDDGGEFRKLLCRSSSMETSGREVSGKERERSATRGGRGTESAPSSAPLPRRSRGIASPTKDADGGGGRSDADSTEVCASLLEKTRRRRRGGEADFYAARRRAPDNDDPELVLFGHDISSLSPSAQFAVCAAGVFAFTVMYGYLQELLQVHIAGRRYGLFLATAQFGGYAFWSSALGGLRGGALRERTRGRSRFGCTLVFPSCDRSTWA